MWGCPQGSAAGTAGSASCVERIAVGGTSQGGVFEARGSTKAAAGDAQRLLVIAPKDAGLQDLTLILRASR